MKCKDQIVGIVGLGFVGSAVMEGLTGHCYLETFDTDMSKNPTCRSLSALADECDIIFVCVPTPMNRDGSVNTSIVERVVDSLNQVAPRKLNVVIKSTVPPGTTDMLQDRCPKIRVMFNPEFLTEKNAVNDFKNQDRILLGYPENAESPYPCFVYDMYHDVFPSAFIVNSKAKEVELSKYVVNTFLALKVSYANELCEITTKLGLDYDLVADLAALDTRLGVSHWRVPGPDGHFGFGGTCFPKDTNGLMAIAKAVGVEPIILKASWEKNLEVRPERDWESLKGRAVTDD